MQKMPTCYCDENHDRITALEKANGQLTDRLIKLEKEFNLLKKPYFEIKEGDVELEKVSEIGCANISVVKPKTQGTTPELTEDSPREIHPKPYELHAVVDHYVEFSELKIVFYDEEENRRLVGEISDKGRAEILNRDYKINNYNLWREKGMKVCSDKVEWRGINYWIDVLFQLRSNIVPGRIYDFERCHTYPECKDDNIIRFKHNNRPILF